jgi:hypothetical protein
MFLVHRCCKSRLHNYFIPIQFCDMLIGYARMSTGDQDLRLQRAALKDVGCKRTFEEKVSGAKRDRPQLAKMIGQLRDDDTVVVTRLDRLARSTRDQGGWCRPALPGRALGGHYIASGSHGADRVCWHR